MAACLFNNSEIFNFYWEIKNLCYARLKNGESIKSPSFSLPNTTWHIRLYPKGKDVNCEDYISLYLIREEDNGPETIDITNNFSVPLYASDDSTNSFRKGVAKGCDKFLSTDMKISYEKSLTINCKIHYNSSSVDSFSGTKNIGSFSKNITATLKVQAATKFEELQKGLFAWPKQTFASSEICFINKSIQWPVDELLVVFDDFSQIIPVISKEHYPPLTIIMKKNEDFICAEIIFGLRNSLKKKTILIFTLNLLVENEESVFLLEEEYEFQNQKPNACSLNKIIKVSDLKTILNKSFKRCTKWKIDITIIDGSIFSEVLNNEYGKTNSRCSTIGFGKILDENLLFDNESKFYDVIIKVKDKTLHAHKFVLSVMSPVFSSILSADMQENQKNVINIMDFDEDVVVKMLFFMYTGTVQNLKFGDAHKLFTAAEKYEVTLLMKLGRNILIECFPLGAVALPPEFLRLYHLGVDCDAAIQAKDKTIYAPKIILSSVSPIFYDILTRDMEDNVINVEDFEESIIDSMISFIYTGSIKNLKFDDAQKLSYIADKYKIRLLMNLSKNIPIECLPICLCKIYGEMSKIYEESKFCDVKIEVKDKIFYAHKIVLCSESTVFQAMFTADMNENKNNLIKITDIEEDVVTDLLSFMYTGSVKNLTFDNVQKIFLAADKYNIISLMSICRNFLIENLTFDNIVEVLHFAVLYNDNQLQTTIIKAIFFWKEKIFNTEEWKEFEKEHANVAIHILRKLCF